MCPISFSFSNQCQGLDAVWIVKENLWVRNVNGQTYCENLLTYERLTKNVLELFKHAYKDRYYSDITICKLELI